MKTLALCAAILAASTTPSLSVSKHHFSAIATVSDFNGPLTSAPAVADDPLIRKCMPHCSG